MFKKFGLLLLMASAAPLATVLGAPVDDASTLPRDVKVESMEPRDGEIGRAIPHVESRQPLEVAEAINEPRYADDAVVVERDEQALEVREENLIHLTMDCGSADQTKFCREQMGYSCTYRGIETDMDTQNFACSRECECYDDKGKAYIPPYIPLFGPWNPISGEVDNGANATRRDDHDAIGARDEEIGSTFEEAEPAY
ncbi:MAG: hypothetical protein Q9160_002830 [Pyrenula sp. 1 TL-2023]